MRRRGPVGDEEFLRRPSETWLQVVPKVNPVVLHGLRAFAGLVLAGKGLLTDAEVDRLRGIAAGHEEDPPIASDSARQIIAKAGL